MIRALSDRPARIHSLYTSFSIRSFIFDAPYHLPKLKGGSRKTIEAEPLSCCLKKLKASPSQTDPVGLLNSATLRAIFIGVRRSDYGTSMAKLGCQLDELIASSVPRPFVGNLNS